MTITHLAMPMPCSLVPYRCRTPLRARHAHLAPTRGLYPRAKCGVLRGPGAQAMKVAYPLSLRQKTMDNFISWQRRGIEGLQAAKQTSVLLLGT